MLIGTLTALLVGAIIGSSGAAGLSIAPDESIADSLDDLVEDDGRRARANAVVDDSVSLRVEANETFRSLAARIEELADDRNSTPADFEAAAAGLDADSHLARLLDLRYRLRSELTEDEWDALYGDLVVPE